MNNIDIVVCYNDETLEKQMEQSLLNDNENGILSVNLIALDNRTGRFSSAAEAYNHALDHLCKAECIVFCHQDILFRSGSLETIYDYCMKEKLTLWGAAGIEKRGRTYTAWESQTCPKGWSHEVQTLDECLIAANREVFDSIRFDEIVCAGWHFYTVELSLQQGLLNRPVKVFNANVTHLSGGTMDKAFFECEARVAKKYRGKVNLISYTNCWCWTNPFLFAVLRAYRIIRYKI